MRPSRSLILLCSAIIAVGCSYRRVSSSIYRGPFNSGFGYALFQNGSTGIAGASAATRDDGFYKVAIDSQGRYVTTAWASDTSGDYHVALMRYNPNGTVDSTFGNSGVALISTAGSIAGAVTQYEWANNILIDSQGRIIIDMHSENASGGYELVLARFTSNGTLDTTFGSSGFAFYQNNGIGPAGASAAARGDWPQGLRFDSDGRLVSTVNTRNSSGNGEFAVMRFTASGVLDTTFGGGTGYVIYNNNLAGTAGALAAGKSDWSGNLQIDSSGTIVVAGYSLNAAGTKEAAIWRFTSSGVVDAAFGSGGYVLFQNNGNGACGAGNASKDDLMYSIKLDGSGKYLISGQSKNAAGYYESVVWRYNTDGTLDTTFNTTGYKCLNSNADASAGSPAVGKIEKAFAAEIDSSGKILIGGTSNNSSGGAELAVWKLNADGSNHTAFGNSGVFLFNNNSTGIAGATAANRIESNWNLDLTVDSLDRVLVIGNGTNAAGGGEPFILRLLSTGVLDL